MTIEIKYKADRASSAPYCAYTHLDGEYYSEWSCTSFEHAKEKLIQSLKKGMNIKVPPPEHVEVLP